MKMTWQATLALTIFGADAVEAAVYEMFPQSEAVEGDAPAMAAQAAPPQGGALLRTRHGRPAQRRMLPTPQDQTVYPFFAETVYTTTVTRVSHGYGGAEIVVGTIPESGILSLSVYTAEGERHEVHYTENGHVYIAVTLPDGTLEIQEHNPSLAPRWDECTESNEAPEGETFPMMAAAGDVEIDVMVIFDTSAATWAQNNGGVTNFSILAVERMNSALANSGIACTMRLACTYCPNYTYGGDFNTALNSLWAGQGGLSGVATQRNAYGVDVITMMVDTGSPYGTTGLGYVTSIADSAFSVCAVQSVNISHTMSHEIGHNLGCGHSKAQDGGAGAGIYASYAAGWYFTGNNSANYHTVMAYNSNAGQMYNPCNYFSTPLKTFQGVAVGHAQDGDNTRCIQERMATVAAFRSPPTYLPPPSTVSASDGTNNDYIRITWASVSGAISYKVYRHTSNNSASASLIATVDNTTLQYDDATAVSDVIYCYWLKASGVAIDSAFSPMASGRRGNPFTFEEALNDSSLEWTTGGNAPWLTQTAVTHDTLHAAQSGPIGHNQRSWIETTVTGPGTLDFWWRVSSESGCDELTFHIDNKPSGAISGIKSWAQRSFNISAGTHILKWTYEKDSSVDNGSDCGWLDDVQWFPTQTQTSPRPVPYFWLADMYPNAGSGNYEALAKDQGSNGYAVWESYVAGLIPTNTNSRFTARVSFVNGSPVVKWYPDLGTKRVYTLFGNATLNASGWTETDPDAIDSGMRFFKVEVDLP